MEDYQKNHITENLLSLIENTKNLETYIIPSLLQEKIFSNSDFEEIKTIPNMQAKTHKFYEIIVTRAGSYNKLIEILKSGSQSGAIEILEKCRGPYHINNEISTSSTTQQVYLNPPNQLVEALSKEMSGTDIIICTSNPEVTNNRLGETLSKITHSCRNYTDKVDEFSRFIKESGNTIYTVHVKHDSEPLKVFRIAVAPGPIKILSKLLQEQNFISYKVIEDQISWNDISVEKQKTLLTSPVIFQNTETNLLALVNRFCHNQASKHAFSEVNGELLTSLLSNRIPTIYEANVVRKTKHYIPKRLRMKARISAEIITDVELACVEGRELKEILLFRGLQWNELTALITKYTQIRITGRSTEQVHKDPIDVPFILMDGYGFETICKKTSKSNVHLLHCKVLNENEEIELEWIKSKGALTLIQKHVHNIQKQCVVNEDEFVNKLCTTYSESGCLNYQPQIISASPGMGKSTLLCSIADKLVSRVDGFVKVVVKCRNVRKFISRLALKSNLIEDDTQQFVIFTDPESKSTMKNEVPIMSQDIIDELINSLTSCDFVNKLFRLNFSNAIPESGLRWELMFDGLDELSETQFKLAKSVFGYLIKTRHNTRIWVTTRPHLVEELEESFSVLCTTIEQFERPEQVEFLMQLWKGSGITNEKKLKSACETCLDRLEKTVSDEPKCQIAGIPLLCQFIGDMFREDVIEYCKENEINDFSRIMSNMTITKIFSEFIGKIFRLKISDKVLKNSVPNPELLSCLYQHMIIATKLLFPKLSKKVKNVLMVPFGFNTEERTKSSKSKDIFSFGILQGTTKVENLEFIHMSLAEYFIALLILELVDLVQTPSSSIISKDEITDTLTSLCSYVFSTRSTFKNVSQVLCESVRHNKTPSFNFKHYHICYFLSALLKEKLKSSLTKQLVTTYSRQNENKFVGFNLWKCLNAVVLGNLYNLSVPFIDSVNELHNTEAQRQYFIQCISEKGFRFEDLIFLAAKCAQKSLVENICTLLIKWCNKPLTGFERHYPQSSKGRGKYLTPLHVAIESGNYCVVEYFLGQMQFNDEIPRRTLKFSYLMDFCLLNSRHDTNLKIIHKENMIPLLMEKCQNIFDEDTYKVLLLERVNLKLLYKMLQTRYTNNSPKLTSVNKLGETFYHLLPTHFNKNMAAKEYEKWLRKFSKFVDIDWSAKDHRGCTPLEVAVTKFDLLDITLEYVNFSLDPGMSDYEGNNIVFKAIMSQRNVLFINKLIERYGLTPKMENHVGENALHIAAAYLHYDAVILLIRKYKFDVTMRDREGNTALHKCLTCNSQVFTGKHSNAEPNNQIKILKILLEEGPQVIAYKNIHNLTALHYAHGLCDGINESSTAGLMSLLCNEKVGTQWHADLVPIFADAIVKHCKGADLKWKDGNGATILHFAARYHSFEGIKYLIDTRKIYKGNEQDCENKTPLNYMQCNESSCELVNCNTIRSYLQARMK